jgi:GNAT superfamily N-acetyltransferase
VTIRAPETLNDAHRIETFESGVPALDDWLRKRARSNQASGASRTYVAADGDEVVGYYAVASGSITAADSVGKFRRNMPEPIPVVVLARLAIAKSHQGLGLGRALVSDCARRVISAGDMVGVRGLIVHAISEEARTFYEALGFYASPLNAMTLMVTMDELKRSL